jgi:hypothetical protein
VSRISATWRGIQLRLVEPVHRAVDTADRALRYEVMRRFCYAPRPDDIFVVSYPKSGTTLMQMMLLQLTTDGDLSRFPHLDAFSPWFEYDLDLTPDTGSFLESLPRPRVFKSHLERKWLPKEVRFIYLARNLPDVALSAYHHFGLMAGRQVELDPFVDSLLAGHPMFAGNWFRHLRSWWPHRDDPNVLFLDYDEMIADLPGTARRVARFCDIQIPETEMPRIVERCGIAYMREHEPFFQPRLHARLALDRGALGRGVTGAGRRELSPAERRLLEGPLAALARELGPTQEGLTEPPLPLFRPEPEPETE